MQAKPTADAADDPDEYSSDSDHSSSSSASDADADIENQILGIDITDQPYPTPSSGKDCPVSNAPENKDSGTIPPATHSPAPAAVPPGNAIGAVLRCPWRAGHLEEGCKLI